MPALLKDEVHVHFFSTDLPHAERTALLPVLSEEEQARAKRFRFAQNRQHYIAAHAGLHLLLARYGAGSPGALAFVRDPGGKPRLVAGPRFSLSHASGMAAVAISETLEVGIDLEKLLEEEDPELFTSMCSTACSHKELLLLQSLPEHELPRTFTRLWVVKEALIKAQGQGLRIPLSTLEISLNSPVKPAPPSWNGIPWFAAELAAPPGYAAALATLVRAPDAIRLFTYEHMDTLLTS